MHCSIARVLIFNTVVFEITRQNAIFCFYNDASRVDCYRQYDICLYQDAWSYYDFLYEYDNIFETWQEYKRSCSSEWLFAYYKIFQNRGAELGDSSFHSRFFFSSKNSSFGSTNPWAKIIILMCTTYYHTIILIKLI